MRNPHVSTELPQFGSSLERLAIPLTYKALQRLRMVLDVLTKWDDPENQLGPRCLSRKISEVS